MNDGIEELIAFSRKIQDDRLSFEEAQTEAEVLEKKYGKNIFNPYIFEKKPKPWNKEYYDELVSLTMTGASSKEFLLHMAEVKDYLKEQTFKTKIINKLNKIIRKE